MKLLPAVEGDIWSLGKGEAALLSRIRVGKTLMLKRRRAALMSQTQRTAYRYLTEGRCARGSKRLRYGQEMFARHLI